MIRAALVATLVLGAMPAYANQIDDGRDAVELHLVRADRWAAVRCRSARYENDTYLYCHPAGDDSFGGLFLLGVSKGKPVVEPVNGKAKQYMNVDEIDAMDNTPIAVRE